MKLDEILSRTFDLYHKYAIKSVTMDDVARELGISKKTLYQYVANKNELVEKVVLKEMEAAAERHRHIKEMELNAIEELFEVSKIMNEHIKRHNPALYYDLRKYYPALHRKIINQKREKAFEAVLRNLKKGISEGLYRKEIKAEVIAKLYVSRLEHNYDESIFSVEEVTSIEVFKEILIYHLHGICNENGLKILNKRLSEIINRD